MGLNGLLIEIVFQMLHMCLVQMVVLADDRNAFVPFFVIVDMLFEPVEHFFGFAHIDGVVHRLIAAKQKVYAGILAIGAMRKARQRASGSLVNAAISV